MRSPIPIATLVTLISLAAHAHPPRVADRTSSADAVCPADYKPILAAVAESQSGLPVSLTVQNPISGVTYEFHLASREDFGGGEVIFSTMPTIQFTRSVAVDRRKFYTRVRATGCGAPSFSARSDIVIFATPTTSLTDPNLKAQFGTTQLIPFNLFIPGSVSGNTTVTLSPDALHVTVTPPSIAVPAGGATVNGVVDPAELPAGTSTTSVTITNATTGATVATVPISLTLLTPVIAAGRSPLVPGSIIVPVMGHVKRPQAEWVSDLQLANVLEAAVHYQMTFTPSEQNGLENGKQTVLRIDSGQTIAFSNVAEQEFGVGATGEPGAGMLEIRPLDLARDIGTAPPVFVSSRTYHQSGDGTVGQSVPAFPATAAIEKPLSSNRAVIVLQPIAENSTFRTNLGVLEVSGQPASVLIRLLDPLGHLLAASTVELRPAEHQQINSFPLRHGISLDEGRIELEVTSLTGSIMAYASVVDATSEDALFVPGTGASESASTWIVPAVVRSAETRTDLRVLNSGSETVSATLTFYRTNQSVPSSTTSLSIAPAETKVLDDIMLSLFGETTAAGTVRVTTPSAASLRISGRTLTTSPTATSSSYLEARVPAQAAGVASRSIQILQLEESERFETHLGIVEVGGNAALIRVSGAAAESSLAADLSFTTQGNETRELPRILNQLGLGRVYNGRVAVQVMQGGGRVIAYAIVRDLKTGDVTVVQGQ